MNKKDRRIRLFLEFFFLAAGIYTLSFKAWQFYSGVIPNNFFDFYNGTIPVFEMIAYLFVGLAAFISAWALWARAPWAPGWCMFTMGMLLYGNITSMGPAIFDHPVQTIPMVVIVLVVLQSFPFLIRNTQRYP